MLAFQRRIFMTFPLAAALALALLAPMLAQAADDGGRGFDPREINRLPPYCKYTQIYRKNLPGGDDPAEIERWTRQMGGNIFSHMHHYCWALQTSSPTRLSPLSRDMRRHNLLLAVGDIDYVLSRVPDDFYLLPEIRTRKGEVLVMLDRGGEGLSEFQRAVEIDPNYWPAYAGMSDYFRDTGQIAKARQSLEKGLSAVPNTRALTRRLAELDAAGGSRRKDARSATAQ